MESTTIQHPVTTPDTDKLQAKLDRLDVKHNDLLNAPTVCKRHADGDGYLTCRTCERMAESNVRKIDEVEDAIEAIRAEMAEATPAAPEAPAAPAAPATPATTTMGDFLREEALRVQANGDSPHNDGRWVPTRWLDVPGDPYAVALDPSFWLVEALDAAGDGLDLFRGVKAIKSAAAEGLADAKRLAVAWAKEVHDADIEEVKRCWNWVNRCDRPVTVGTVWWAAEQRGWFPPQPHQWFRAMSEPSTRP